MPMTSVPVKPPRTVHFSLNLDEADYQALCVEWVLRRKDGKRVSLKSIVVEAIRRQVPRGTEC